MEVARVHLKHGAETSAQGLDGWIPLCWDSRHGHVEVARLLFKHSADVNVEDQGNWDSIADQCLRVNDQNDTN